MQIGVAARDVESFARYAVLPLSFHLVIQDEKVRGWECTANAWTTWQTCRQDDRRGRGHTDAGEAQRGFGADVEGAITRGEGFVRGLLATSCALLALKADHHVFDDLHGNVGGRSMVDDTLERWFDDYSTYYKSPMGY